MQERHIKEQDLGWSDARAQKSAKEMYDRMFHMKFLPPGRGMWAMGSPLTEERHLYAALNNCGFVSTEFIDKETTEPFTFLMDASMVGIGVGFDVKGAGKLQVRRSDQLGYYTITDDREGWVESLRRLLDGYFTGSAQWIFDYRSIREKDLPIKGFGGTSSGPEPLMEMHDKIRKLLDNRDGQYLTETDIVDIMNLIGCCVVSGNVRRTAEIVFGPYDSEEYINLKNYYWVPERVWMTDGETEVTPGHFEGPQKDRAAHGWTSNNSIFADIGMDYRHVATKTHGNGEPGYMWLENAKAYGRMEEPANHKDKRVRGANPCQPAFAPLLGERGIITMGEIKTGQLIWTESGWTRVTKKWSTGVKPVYRYTTNAGTFYGTENHRIISEGQKVEVCQAESIDILPGEYIDSFELHPQSILDGLVLGDGTHNERSSVYLCIGENDSDYFWSEVKHLIGEFSSGTTHFVNTTLTRDEVGHINERRIPDRYMRGDAASAGFLRGLYSANGSVCGNRVTLKLVSRKLREQVQLLLSALGIRSYFTTNKSKDVEFSNGVYTCKESYDINITVDRERFAKLIGFIQVYKKERLKTAIAMTGKSPLARSNTKKTYQIIETEYLGDMEVYDITVNSEEHTYWTGGLNVSNCAEQSLEHFELCNLVETFPSNCTDLTDYRRTLKFAYLYAKTVTLGKTHWPKTNKVLLRNRRIGTSMSGIQQFVAKHGLHTLKEWCESGYDYIQYVDRKYSEWFAVPMSVKTTSIKPSGTVSLLAGATPGMHWPESRYYIRRVRLSNASPYVERFRSANYIVEDCVGDSSSVVVEFYVALNDSIRTVSEVSIWEQFAMAAFLQRYWADNQVSCTVTFDPGLVGADEIAACLNHYQYQLKGISLLPKVKAGAYPQMPYEECTEKWYRCAMASLLPLNLTGLSEEATPERGCTNDTCVVDFTGATS
jgi:ribonucleotide reductase alpha subunit